MITKWEYKSMPRVAPPAMLEMLGILGRDGWEAWAFDLDAVWFKRPIPSDDMASF
jgi:hypothetical protein